MPDICPDCGEPADHGVWIEVPSEEPEPEKDEQPYRDFGWREERETVWKQRMELHGR